MGCKCLHYTVLLFAVIFLFTSVLFPHCAGAQDDLFFDEFDDDWDFDDFDEFENDWLIDEELLISNFFFDTDIREALQDIALQANVTILMDDTVSGWVTVEFTDVTLEKALELVLIPGGFIYQKMNDYYLVSAGTVDSPAFPSMARTVRVQLNDLLSQEVLQILPDYYIQYVKVIPNRNFVTITGTDEIIASIMEILGVVDQPRKQVMIDTVVTEISGEEAETLGVEWAGADTGPYSLRFGELASIGGIFQRLERITATLNLLQREGKANIRSNPRLVVLDGETGEIHVTRDEYVAIVTGTPAFPTTTLETITSGVIFEVSPRVGADGYITLTMSPEVSNVVGVGLEGFPVISRRIASTTVRVKDGETIVIGGLRQLIEVTTESKVPLLGDIPLLGALFRQRRTTSEDKDVVILITPRILN